MNLILHRRDAEVELRVVQLFFCWPAQSVRFELIPPFFLISAELARQRFNRNAVLFTKVAP